MTFRQWFGIGALVLLVGACAPSSGKPRCLWIDAAANFAFYGNDAEAIASDCRRIAETGFTDIIVDVRPTSGDVLFHSAVAPELRRMPGWTDGGWGLRERTAGFDYLAAFIESGHRAGLRVHAGLNTMVGGWRAPGIAHGMVYDRPERQAWCAVDATPRGLVNHALDSTTVGARFLDPVNPEVQAFLLDLLAEVAAYPGLDGIVLDRCRFDDYALDAGYSEAAYRAFSSDLGREPERWPVFPETGHIFLEGTPDALEAAWLTFRCRVIRDFVEKAAARVHETAPEISFGIYVGAWFSEYYRSGVNWTSPDYDLAAEEPSYRWASPSYQATGLAPLVDRMYLGTYTGADRVYGEGEKTMEGYARLGRKRLCGDVPFIAGPDIGNEPGFRDGGQQAVIPEVVATLLREADGLFVFDLCHLRQFDYWDAFKEGIDIDQKSL